MSVMENLELGAFARSDKPGIQEDFGRVLTLFPRLKERLAQKGGRCRAASSRCWRWAGRLMARPTVLLLDEPSMGLSPILVETIFQIVQDINRQGTTILLVEQNARMASAWRTGVRHPDGSHRALRYWPELLRSDVVRKTYLGEK